MTLDQAMSLCDALEQLLHKGRSSAAESSVRLQRIETVFAADPASDSYLLARVATATSCIAAHLEASASHLRLRDLGRAAQVQIARLRAAILLCDDSAIMPPQTAAGQRPEETADRALRM